MRPPFPKESTRLFIQESPLNADPIGPTPLYIRAPIQGYSGYGKMVASIALGLDQLGHQVLISPTMKDAKLPIPYSISSKCVRQIEGAKQFLIHAPDSIGVLLNGDPATVYMTMWETTRLNPEWVTHINKCQAIIVPNAWNASCFNACGINSKIYIVPLGIHERPDHPSPWRVNEKFIFGAAGCFRHGGMRKGLVEVVMAFKKAFPSEKNVELVVKSFEDDPVSFPSDPRVHVIRDILSDESMANWYRGVHCFVSASKAEGWGLHQHEALAFGRPVISIVYGGVAEFFDESVGFPVEFDLAPATGLYAKLGLWAVPREESLIEQMRFAFANHDECHRRGLAGAVRARRFTWNRTVEGIERVLKAERFLSA